MPSLVQRITDLAARVAAEFVTLRGQLPPLRVPIHADAGAVLTMTNQPAAQRFLLGASRHIVKVDLTHRTQVRLTARVMVAGAGSPNAPRLFIRYATAFSTATGSYSALGTSEVAVSLSSAGYVDSGWINLVSGARADVFLAPLEDGGDGVADPQLGHVTVEFR